MAEHAKPIDITNSPELLQLAEEVRASKEARVLMRDSEELAVVVPLSARPKKRRNHRKPAADLAAFRASAGGWKGLVDVDKFLEDVYESRRS
jgi:hypothetical protein